MQPHPEVLRAGALTEEFGGHSLPLAVSSSLTLSSHVAVSLNALDSSSSEIPCDIITVSNQTLGLVSMVISEGHLQVHMSQAKSGPSLHAHPTFTVLQPPFPVEVRARSSWLWMMETGVILDFPPSPSLPGLASAPRPTQGRP